MPTRIKFHQTNKSQQYATHGFFRYFGKLPPAATSHIIKKCAVEGELVVDLMSGSGTTLVESQILGFDSLGVEVNPLSALLSKVKTTPINTVNILEDMAKLLSNSKKELTKIDKDKPFASTLEYLSNERPKIANKSMWFQEYTEAELIVLRHNVKLCPNDNIRDFLFVAFLSLIRKTSNASVRTGRIFRKNEPSNEDVMLLFEKKVLSMCEGMKEFISLTRSKNIKTDTKIGDARKSGIKDSSVGFVLNHPPYFALYKYSSDVLRFELEWGEFDRKTISKSEIRDGFKTTKLSDFDLYLADMIEVFKEAYRILKSGRILCIVVNDSTLREEQLPVIDSFVEACKNLGFKFIEHEIRDVLFTQAQYHRSANQNIITKEDHLLYFEK